MKELTFYFGDRKTGKDFFVEEKNEEAAIEKAKKFFSAPKCFGEMPREFAVIVGFDIF